MKSQKSFVCECLVDVLNERGVEYEMNGDVNIKSILEKSDIDEVRRRVCEGFENNEIVMKEVSRVKYIGNPRELNIYVGGLVNNWIRKCKEFNSGIQHKPKNPGIRKGSGDEQVREMRKLLKTISDKETRDQIQSAIDERLELIKPKIEVNASNLPEHLRYLV